MSLMLCALDASSSSDFLFVLPTHPDPLRVAFKLGRHAALGKAHSQHRGPTQPQKKGRVSHTHTSLSPFSHTGTSQSDET